MNAIAMTPVSSSLLKAIGHDAEQSILAVEFHNGAVYHHTGFSEKDYADLRAAPSVGSHYNRFVKGKYDHQRVGSAPATFADMLKAIDVATNVGQAEVALSAVLQSIHYTQAEKDEATQAFNKRHAIVLEG